MKENNKIKIAKLRDTVDIHLSDGRILSGPRSTSAGEFLMAAGGNPKKPIVAAVVNGDLRELSYPIEIESRLDAVKMSTADGARIYRRSLTFLLEFAFQQLFPNGKLTIDHSVSSGGYYCQVSGRETLSVEELEIAYLCYLPYISFYICLLG